MIMLHKHLFSAFPFVKQATSDDSRVHALLTEVVNVAAKRQADAGEEANDMLRKQASKLLARYFKIYYNHSP